ncbi:PKD domain-containing protein [Flaviaesturariibacter aridisoli]|uniref:T9SS type B sorting domain-containing protein n=1 Tax=Flaviaesturariibacter aridisoli TaxID=2545761 RepID=A0A4R4E302_9BACT|nr:PKD domain-containing protein [Flaviaesturariibacter aridisoli]TCZ73914.1 T9SS type B sorting domain-containing protein [Flaviaesturariibacter aridisoli]
MTSRCLLAFCLILTSLFTGFRAGAQCTGAISTFPYTADFELTDGGWVTGGNASDWVWGIPHKPVIVGAANGQKCWVTGGLQYTAYNDNENSWLMSPCFDFSSLPHPYVQFQLFWETERKYDGASFEYSTDGGSNWLPLGSQADYQSCPGSNWFNTTSITTLGSDGWSGNVQATAPCSGGAGGGSGRWVPAGHAMPQLAGRSNVRFRFRFAAGSRCNDYDGFAIDDVWIGELQPASADYTFSCSASRTGQFTPVTIGCGNSYAWDFGDPSTGAANASNSSNPNHTFSSAGDFQVMLTVTAPGGATSTITKTVRVLDVTAQVVQPVRCPGGQDGSIQVLSTPAGTYTYSWSTTPTQQGATATGLGAGLYTVDIRGTNVCAVRASNSLSDPTPVTHTESVEDARCSGPNGKATIIPAGGTGPYNYNWSPAGPTGSGTSSSLRPGAYTVAIADAYGCADTSRFSIGDDTDLLVTIGHDTVLCAGETLLLQPAPGPFSTFQWQDGSSAPAYRVYQTGRYSVQVTDGDGCRNSAALQVTVDCSDVSFPTAFTPNGDGRNDRFGPLGNRGALTDYTLRIYGRWGQLIFETHNPMQSWNGDTLVGKDGSQVYVWAAQYRLVRHDGVQTRKGTVLLMR